MSTTATSPLAERKLLGYPDTSIALHVTSRKGNETLRVVITDPSGTTEWEAQDRADAKDRYFHPFCYGYEHRN